ncbi:hypothetical protein RhiirA4_509025 [Rhizophagus irregularis]|uniref:Uncharacterized protein n=1 Tax=Rhizophagus irregularis TaxID=588596 RepID=A0A2I1HDW9_9GLOM|nr:hypothetical protein RhiirA4_509025 [Rhizophagus irregularis]
MNTIPAKLTLICEIHSIVEQESNNFITKETISIMRKEVPKWIPDFTSGDVVRFTGKFSLNEEPPHDDILEEKSLKNFRENISKSNKRLYLALTSDNSSEAEADKNQDEYFEIKSESTD